MKTIDIQERRLEDVSAGLNNNAPPLLESPFCFIYILIRNENGSKCHQAITAPIYLINEILQCQLIETGLPNYFYSFFLSYHRLDY